MVLRGGSRKDISDQIGPSFDVCHAQCILTRHCTILSLEEASLDVIMNYIGMLFFHLLSSG